MTINNQNTIGYTVNTTQHLIIDAGCVYKNYGLATEAMLGATSGGNEFDVKVKTRDVKVDGLKGFVRGLRRIISTDVTLKVNMLEVTTETLRLALMGNVSSTPTDYDIITGDTQILDTDYVDNIALVGKVSGYSNPIVIMLKNAISSDGIKFSNKDAVDNILPITFIGSIDPLNPTISPYEIRYPKLASSALPFYLLGSPVIDNGKVLLTFSDTVNASVFKDGFAVTVAGTTDVITAISRGVNQLNTILLTLTTTPTSGQAVTVSYTLPAPGVQITSASGAVLDTFASTTVINN